MKKLFGIVLLTAMTGFAQSGQNLIGNISPSQVKTLAPSATTDTTNAGNITSGTLSSTRLPTPTATTPGGVDSITAVTHEWIDSIVGSAPHASQPTFADLGAGTIGVAETVGTGGSIVPSGTGTVTATNFSKLVSIASVTAAGCIAGTASSALDLTATAAPTPSCHVASNPSYATFGTLDFSPNQTAWLHVTIPSDWVAQKDGYKATVVLKLFTNLISQPINFTAAGFCYEGTAPVDPTTGNPGGYITGGGNLTSPATANLIFKQTAEFNTTNCNPGDELFIPITRGDAISGTVSLLSANIFLTRTF